MLLSVHNRRDSNGAARTDAFAGMFCTHRYAHLLIALPPKLGFFNVPVPSGRLPQHAGRNGDFMCWTWWIMSSAPGNGVNLNHGRDWKIDGCTLAVQVGPS